MRNSYTHEFFGSHNEILDSELYCRGIGKQVNITEYHK